MEMKIFTIIGVAFFIGIIGLFNHRIRKFAYVWLGLTGLGVAGLFGAIQIYGTTWLINPGPPTKGDSAEALGINVVTVAKGLESPWSVAFLPDGRFLVTEKNAGKLKILNRSGATLKVVKGVPQSLGEGQGGLLEVALHPNFKTNKIMYLTFSEGTPDSNSTAVGRGIFENDRITDFQVIFRQAPKVKSDQHFGGRLLFMPSNVAGHPYYLFITLGDRYDFRDKAQSVDNHQGKLVRLFDDGSVPADNPFVGKANAKPEIYTYGHRNMQGITTAADGTLLTIEHGPQGGDELNAPQPGKNYGWPVITYGEEYGGGPIGKGIKAQAGMEQPLHYWVPSIAPSGAVRLSSDVYQGWKDNLFVTSLAHMQLVRLEMNGTKVVKEHRLLAELNERLRDVKQGPDGKLYVLTDNDDGRLLRLDPK
jgi:aldose sugar dehydrogenase